MKFYNDIFSTSWGITKKNRVLWMFGFFVLFWGGKSIDVEVFFTNSKLLTSSLSPFQPEFWQVERWYSIIDNAFPHTTTLVGFFILVVVLALFVLALMVISQIGLVDAYAKKTKKYPVSQALDQARTHGWSVLSINIVGRVVSYGLLAIASTPLFLDQFVGSRVVYTAFLFLVLTPLSILVSLLTKYAVADRIIKGNGVVVSIANAWMVFVGNIGVSIEMALMMFITYFAVTVGAIVSALVILLPFFFIGVLLFWNTGGVLGIELFYVFFYVVTAIILTISASIFSAWHFGNWTILYQQLTNGRQRSKIHRTWKK